MLLERNDVNSGKADQWGQTPLLRAAANGPRGIVRALLDRNDADPDKADKWGQTPLLWAAANRPRAIVSDGVTPSWYVRLGHTCRCEQGY